MNHGLAGKGRTSSDREAGRRSGDGGLSSPAEGAAAVPVLGTAACEGVWADFRVVETPQGQALHAFSAAGRVVG